MTDICFCSGDDPYLLFANDRFIQRVNLDGRNLQVVSAASSTAVGLDYDYR